MAYTKLQGNTANFDQLMHGFGVVTVYDADIYEVPENTNVEPREFIKPDSLGTSLAHLDSLKIANITIEGPSKTVTGGQYSNPLIKFGKSARIEMQDALGRADAVEAFGGCVNTYGTKVGNSYSDIQALHVTEDFASPKTVVGKTFFIDQKTGQQVPVTIILYKVLPDSIFNLTQDAEGDATVFDLNGDLLTTVIKLNNNDDGKLIDHGVFYSILPEVETVPVTIKLDSKKEGSIKATCNEPGATIEYSDNAGVTFGKTSSATEGNTVVVRALKKGVELARTSFVVEARVA